MKTTIRIGMLLVIVAILFGCGRMETVDPVRSSDEPITLRVFWWGGDFRNNATIQAIEMYEKQNPHVNIEFEYTGFNEYWKKLAPYAAGNALPDIIQMDVSYLAQYGTLDLLEDLTPYMDKKLIDATHISDNNLSGGKIGDHLLGINLGVNALFSVYDPEVFKQHGIAPPAENWTWSDFESMGEQLKGKGVYVGTDLTPEQFFAYFLRQNGRTLFAADGTKLGYEDDELFVDYFGRMQRMAKAQLIFSPDIWYSDVRLSDSDPFYTGGALLGWGYSNQFITTAEKYGKPLQLAPIPGPNRDQGMFLKPGMFFSVAKNSKYKDEAAKFISFFVNDLEANKIMKAERGVPVSAKVKDDLKPFLEPEQQQVFEYVEWVEQHSSPIDPPDPVGTGEVTAVLRNLYDLLLFDKITPQAAAAEFRTKANAILERNKK